MYRRNSSSHPESGYILLAVLFMVALVLIALAVAAPRISADIQRDREDDLYHRGLQYKRAIKLYYKKFGNYPASIDQLENTNNIRFLRKRYVDPMTGKDDWKIIHFGEAHVKAMGLFGQPIQAGGLSPTTGGSLLGGAASGGMYASNVGTSAASTATASSSSTDSSGSSTSGTGTDASGSSTSTTSGTSPTGTTSAFGGSSPGGFGTSSSGSSPFGSSSSSSGFGSSGSTFGGAPMVGIASKSTKASIKEYKQQKHYNEWEFVYDPTEDLLSSVSLLGGGGTSNVTGTSGTSPGVTTPGTSTTPFGSSNPGSGSGITGGMGSGSGSTPNPPQQ